MGSFTFRVGTTYLAARTLKIVARGLPQSAQLASSGTVVVFGNTDTRANVTVLKGVP